MIRKFRDDIVVERVGEEYVILSRLDGVVHRLSSVSQEAVDALLLGHDVSGFESDIATLDGLGLLQTEGRATVSRRQAVAGLAGVVGAGVVTVALPTAAFASSQDGPLITDTTFGWSNSTDLHNPEFEIVNNIDLAPLGIFVDGAQWEISFSNLDGVERSRTGIVQDGNSNLPFSGGDFVGLTITEGAVLEATLVGPEGQTFTFKVPKLPPG